MEAKEAKQTERKIDTTNSLSMLLIEEFIKLIMFFPIHLNSWEPFGLQEISQHQARNSCFRR